ncbi:MAG TPA: peptidylprolyl isomerase [Candidatus Paceibacterota bacterium]|nr:peptidylprolyl isomerase [Candidatus Paceibacterota bacterium]
MLKRTWFPGLVALIIVFCVYWFGIRDSGPSTTLDPYNQNPAAQNPGISNSQIQTPTQQETPSTSDIKTIMDNITTATLHTNKGDITIQFNPETPITAANFVKLAKAGFYNGTKFHRVIKGFMDQGGDPFSKDDSLMARWGTGGPGYQFEDEIGPDNKNDVGTIAMANAGPNTNGSQFFLNAAANNFLDDKHTVFGKVTKGLDIVMAINNVQTDENDRPVSPVVIESVDLK